MEKVSILPPENLAKMSSVDVDGERMSVPIYCTPASEGRRTQGWGRLLLLQSLFGYPQEHSSRRYHKCLSGLSKTSE